MFRQVGPQVTLQVAWKQGPKHVAWPPQVTCFGLGCGEVTCGGKCGEATCESAACVGTCNVSCPDSTRGDTCGFFYELTAGPGPCLLP